MPHTDPSLSIAQRIDLACDRFEAEWKAGKLPSITDFVAAAPESDRESLRQALLAIELELQGRSEADTSVTQSSIRNPVDVSLAATALHAPTSSDALKKIGRFDLRGVLGSGAFGKVYRAFDSKLNREVAIKVPMDSAVRTDAERVQFLKEARAIATINHPNVCQVFEVGEFEDRPYIVMALVPGLSLADAMKSRKTPLPQKQSALIIRKIAAALAAAHEKGIVHRDLKPANIMFDRDRKDIVVMDFGLARGPQLADARSTQSGVIMGTPAYMSPEQARGDAKGVGPSGDVFSLGVILYEMLTGFRPFTGTATEVIGQILHVEPERPSQRRAGVDLRLESICLKAMAKDPAARFSSMKEFAAAIDTVLRETLAPSAPGETARADKTRGAAQEESSGDTNLADVFAVMFAERKKSQAETAAVVEAAIRKAHTPRWVFIALGLIGIFGITALAGLIFFTKSGPVTVTIELNDIDLTDQSLSFFLDDQPISAETLASPVELKPGEHILVVKRGDIVVKRMRLNVTGGRNPGIKAKDITLNRAGPYIELVRELQTPANELDCWLTPDGLVIYFLREGAATATPGIFRATRPNTGTPFGLPKFVSAGRHVTLSADEKCLVVLREGQGSQPILQASRTSTQTPFGEFTVIPSLLEDQSQKAPSLSRDGRTLIFQRSDKTHTYPGQTVDGVHSEFCVSRRSTVTEAWSAPQRLPIRADPALTHVCWPMLSDDELLLFFGNGGTRWDTELMYAVRTSTQEPFGIARRITVDGKQVYGRSPRYIAATNELYFSWDPGTKEAPPDLGIYVIKNFVPVLPTPESNGFVSLFNGKDLTGWTPESNDTENWKVQNGAITGIADEGVPRPGEETWLLSDKEYQDFILRFEFRAMTETVNSGFAYRAVPREKPPVGAETYAVPSHLQVEIFDSSANRTNQKLKTGTVLGSLGPQVFIPSNSSETQKPRNEWNSMEVEAHGQSIRIRLNGTELVNGSLDDLIARGATYPGLKRQSGRIAFQRLRGTVQFRDIQIKALKPTDDGWIDLFNGRDLSNWMTNEGQVPSWKVENGYMEVVPGAGSIVTRDNYPLDFELHAEFWLPKELDKKDQARANSGVYLHGRHEIQICDGYQNPITKPNTACGGLFGEIAPALNACTAPETWQTFDVTYHSPRVNANKDVTQSGRLTVIHNGQKIINDETFRSVRPGATLHTDRIGEPGPIMLQDHGSPVRFRSIRIRPIAPLVAADDGWEELFNGKDLTGWKAVGTPKWSWSDDRLIGTASPSGGTGFLITDADFENFELELQYRLNQGMGSGLFLRADLNGPETGKGQLEVQIADDDAHQLQPLVATGSIYNVFQRKVNPPLTRGDWNTLRVRLNRRQIEIYVNDIQTIDSSLDAAHDKFAAVPGLQRKTGRIALQQNQKADVEFRNVRIRRLGE